MAYLVVTMDGKELYRRELSDPLTVGRSTECDLWLNDGGVSRRHCRFERSADGAWEVIDLGSRNGVVLHGQRVAHHRLSDGDAVHVGGARITFHAVGYVASRPSRPAAPQAPGDSISETIIAASAPSRTGRALPMPRPRKPARASDGADAAPSAAPLPFTRPPARPIPAAAPLGAGTHKMDPDDPSRREGLFRRLLHK